MLIHSSGEYVTSTYPLVIKDLNNPQSIGSVVTYARRYTLAAIAGVAQVDDDGEAALGRTHEKLPNQPKATNHIAIEANPKLALLVTEAQLKRLYAIQQKSKMSQDDVINFIKTNFQKNNSKELTMSEYDALIKALETF
jgi:hypothetical protein